MPHLCYGRAMVGEGETWLPAGCRIGSACARRRGGSVRRVSSLSLAAEFSSCSTRSPVSCFAPFAREFSFISFASAFPAPVVIYIAVVSLLLVRPYVRRAELRSPGRISRTRSPSRAGDDVVSMSFESLRCVGSRPCHQQ